MTNHARGESALVLNGKSYTVALTLGVLAKIEAAFGGVSFIKVMNERFTTNEPAIGDVAKFFKAILEGNGHAEAASEIDAMTFDKIPALMESLMSVLGASGMAREAKSEPVNDPFDQGAA